MFGKTGVLAVAIALLIAPVTAPPVAVAQSNESVAAFRDWSVFNPSNPRECYIVTPPTSWEARRGGEQVRVNRGEILLFVTKRPEEGVSNEISYTTGYPIRPGSTVEVNINGTTFSLAPGSGESDEWAWPPSPERDAAIVAAMREGTTARITAVSSRGTQTIDSFSLLGFTAALEEAERLCS